MRRGQAALEFLTTYGWAFLVILVMIGALAYFGVINPNRFLPERCSFQQELGCDDFQLVSDENGDGNPNDPALRLFVRNNLGQTMTQVRIAVANTASGTSPDYCSEGGDATIPPGGLVSMNCTTISGTLPAVGDKVKLAINGSYLPSQGQFRKLVSGEVFAVLNS